MIFDFFSHLDFWMCGNCSQTHFKISILPFWKSTRLKQCQTHWLNMCMFVDLRTPPTTPWSMCLPQGLFFPKKTRPWIFGACILWIWSISGELCGQGWGNPGPGAGGTARPVLGEPLGRTTWRHSLLEKVRTPSGKPGWGICCYINGHHKQYIQADIIFNYMFHFGLPGTCLYLSPQNTPFSRRRSRRQKGEFSRFV